MSLFLGTPRKHSVSSQIIRESHTQEKKAAVSSKFQNLSAAIKDLYAAQTGEGRPKGTAFPTRQELLRFVRLGKSEIRFLGGAISALVVSSFVNLAYPRMMGRILDAIGSSSPVGMEALYSGAGSLLGLFFVGAVASCFRGMLLEVVRERISARLRKDLFGSIVSQEMAFFDANRSGELINRLSTDVTLISKALSENVSYALHSFISCFGGIALLLYLSPKLTAITISVFPTIGFAAVLYGRYVKKLSRQVLAALADATTVAEERLSNIRVVRFFANELHEKERYSRKVTEAYRQGYKVAVATGIYSGLIALASNVSMLLVLFAGGSQVLQHNMTVGDLTSFSMYAMYVGVGFSGLSSMYGDLMKAIGASERVFYILERKAETSQWGTGVVPSHLNGRIDFEGVCFEYLTRPGLEILRDFTLTLHPGKVVALVGFSGSGKSTVASLVGRLYEPTRGRILLDGTDIKNIEPHWLRKHIGVVTQDPILFADTIAENIRYGDPTASQEKVIQVAKEANVHDFVMKLPAGYDTLVGERGVALSGGQKQRVAIARALLKDPRILILDEATSALDSESERLVQDALQRLMKGRTCLLIAHRLSTIMYADEVAVLHDGRIVQTGSPQDLLASPTGIFPSLVGMSSI